MCKSEKSPTLTTDEVTTAMLIAAADAFAKWEDDMTLDYNELFRMIYHAMETARAKAT